jgi:hypothetical protein
VPPTAGANTDLMLYLRERLPREEGLAIREVSVLTNSIGIEFEEAPPFNGASALRPAAQVAHLLDLLRGAPYPYDKVVVVGVDYRTHERNLLLVYTGTTVQAHYWDGMSAREIARNAVQASTPWWWAR